MTVSSYPCAFLEISHNSPRVVEILHKGILLHAVRHDDGRVVLMGYVEKMGAMGCERVVDLQGYRHIKNQLWRTSP